MTPEGLYGRRKMTALVRRHLPSASAGSVDRAMRTLGLSGIRRSKGIRTTIPATDGTRAGDLLNRDFTAPAPNHVWVMDFTYCSTWAGFVYVAFVVDVFAQTILGWHAQTCKDTGLVTTAARMAMWHRHREGHRPSPGQLIGHSDAGSQGGFNRSSQRRDGGGVWWDYRRRSCRRRRWVLDGSGPRIGRCVLRCVHRDGRCRPGLCSGASGG
jgi:transposase InsO family protein